MKIYAPRQCKFMHHFNANLSTTSVQVYPPPSMQVYPPPQCKFIHHFKVYSHLQCKFIHHFKQVYPPLPYRVYSHLQCELIHPFSRSSTFENFSQFEENRFGMKLKTSGSVCVYIANPRSNFNLSFWLMRYQMAFVLKKNNMCNSIYSKVSQGFDKIHRLSNTEIIDGFQKHNKKSSTMAEN